MSAETKALAESAKTALQLAKKHGCSDASANASMEREVNTQWRDGKIEKVSDATSKSVSLGVYVDGKYGSMTTNDLRPAALDKFVADAVSLVRALAKDPHRKLPDPSLYAGRHEGDLEIFDPDVAGLTSEMRVARARSLEEAARSVPGSDKIVSVTTNVGDSTYHSFRVTTNGFEGGYRATSIWVDAETAVKDDDGRRPEDYSAAAVRFAKDLPSDAEIGKDATLRALAKLGAKKMGSGTMPIIVEARAARGLLGHLMGPMSGGALQQKQSFYEGRIGKQVASKAFTLTDEPLVKRGLASRAFDSEGITAKPRALIEKGVLKSYLLDTYYASKLGLSPTTGRVSNLVVAPGTKSLATLLKDMKNGILVTSFLGGNSNSTTGVFSLGLAGYRVANGEKKEAVSEMNLSGKHVDFWSKLVAAGDDPYRWSSWRSPSLMFDGTSIAGK
ncbi:MAG: TldD/PmbA family protein [Labilithrix sp.]|nr:TldD/PmbA family protein [Labilithrix sp.]MCW5816503.1 TldD/PmbA family protein [Labilithrix sp.]